MFGAGNGRFSYNFPMYKDSYVPEHEPGGGGWGLQELSLSNLYIQNKFLMNWWTKSNRGLNLCRYTGCKIYLYREQTTDYIFSYDVEPPYDVSKYYYATLHPQRMLNYHKKILVPSFVTQPHNKKPYIVKRLPPPREMLNKWYFQKHFSTYPLLRFSCTACSLQSMFLANNTLNNNVSVFSLNTRFFKNPKFQYPKTGTYGYIPQQNTYIYGVQTPGADYKNDQINTATYLGDTMINDEGDPINGTTWDTYKPPKWGNPLYFRYLNGDYITFISSTPPDQAIQNKTQKISTLNPQTKTEPFIYTCRYNPNKDTGEGNMAYWVSNLDSLDWEPPKDTDLIIQGFPLWIMLWGWYDMTQKIGKIRPGSGNYILVIRSNAFDEKLPAYVLLNRSFVEGFGPYNTPRDDININDYGHWYPRWHFQREAIESLLMSGPTVCRNEHAKSISAHMGYKFFLKWGGNPSEMENVYDPTQQKTYPTPNLFNLSNEIDSPETDITNFIYNWDVRRHFLTQTAEKRIKQIETHDESLFADGAATSTDAKISLQTTPQTETTEEKEKEEILHHLDLLQQYNNQLRLRYLTLQQQLTEL